MFGHRRAFFVMSAILMSTCADPTNVQDESRRWDVGDLPPSLGVIATLPAVCGDATLTRLIADETVPVGTVEVTQDGTDLYGVFRTDAGWPIHKTALFVGSSRADIPTTKSGNPRIGQFPYAESHAATNEVIWRISLGSLALPDLVIAAFAEVGAEYEGAWGEGEMIDPGGSWAMYFAHEVPDCVGETIGSEGGTVATQDGGAILSIDPGALNEPTDITVESATVDDLLELASNQHQPSLSTSEAGFGIGGLAQPASPSAAHLELPTVFGVTPIEGTVWNLGPDGLEFLTPATVTLHYDESALPEGIREEELGAFVINGIFEELPSTIDADANTVSASVEHFSFVFVGWAPPAPVFVDLRVAGISGPPSAPVGTPMDFQATVGNDGPADSGAGTLTYEFSGPATLGDLPGSCVEMAGVGVGCDLPPLKAGSTQVMPAIQLNPVSSGAVTVQATVRPGEGGVDENPGNDSQQVVVAVGATVDLEMTGISVSGDPRVGVQLEFVADSRNNGPLNSGLAKVTYHALGDVVLGAVLTTECTEIPTIYDVSLSCNVFGTAPGNPLLIFPFRLIPESEGPLTVWAVLENKPGETDPIPDNNQQEVRFDVTEGLVDLSPSRFSVLAPDGSYINSTLYFSAVVANAGPDPAWDHTLVFQVSGDVVLLQHPFLTNCTEVANPVGFDLEVVCDGGALVSGEIVIVPQALGDVTVRATAASGPGQLDLDKSNDTEEITVEIVPRPSTGS